MILVRPASRRHNFKWQRTYVTDRQDHVVTVCAPSLVQKRRFTETVINLQASRIPLIRKLGFPSYGNKTCCMVVVFTTLEHVLSNRRLVGGHGMKHSRID